MACQHYYVVHDNRSGDIICPTCALVLESSVIDDRQETNSDYLYENCADTANMNFHQNASGTNNASQSRSKTNITYGNLEDYTQEIRLKDFCDKLQLAYVQKEDAVEVLTRYKVANTTHTYVRSKNKDMINLACIYHACKKSNVARSFSELSQRGGVYEMDIRKAYKHMLSVLKEDATANTINSTTSTSTTTSTTTSTSTSTSTTGTIGTTNPTINDIRTTNTSGTHSGTDTPEVTSYFSRWCSYIGCGSRVAMKCHSVFKTIDEKYYRGRKPTVVAAAVLCIIYKKISNKELKEVCNVTPFSVRQLQRTFEEVIE